MLAVLEQTRAVSTCKRCLPSVTTILSDYIPTFRFGVLSRCRAVSISINPAENQEGYRPLPRCKEYGFADRSALTDDDLANVARRSDEYFAAGDKHRFFNTLASVVSSIDPTWSYEAGTLSHIDVVACVTRPTWTNGVPAEERRVMLESCRQHFLTTLRLLPSDSWLLCDGRTALQAIDDVGGRTENTEQLEGNLAVCIGTLLLEAGAHRFVGWNYPAHKLYGKQTEVGLAAKCLMDGGIHDPKAEAVLRPSPESSSLSSCIADRLVFTSQRDLMRFLVGKLGHNQDSVCREYAAADRQGLVPRNSNRHGLSAEQYAHRLYADGIRNGWL